MGVYLALNPIALYNLINYKLRPEKYRNEELVKIAEEASSYKLVNTKRSLLDDKLKTNHLYYPELGIDAPVFWNVTDVKSNEQMNYGLTHIEGTSLPESGGEILISGHSSYYWWQKGNFKEVFVNLGKSKTNDKILLRKDKIYIYSIVDIYEIQADQEIEIKTSGDSKLKLMTCVPIGTNLKRLIVEAELVSTI